MPNEAPLTSFQHAIRQTHGCGSHLLTREPVIEKFRGKNVWAGEVLTFLLHHHPTARFCYAWEVDGRVTAVLHTGPVNSPLTAVRAAIVAEHRERNRETK